MQTHGDFVFKPYAVPRPGLEPKWDGFRALVFREGKHVEILSKSGKSLARYFPEIVAMIAAVMPPNVTNGTEPL